MALSTGDWTRGFNETKCVRKSGRVVHLKSTHIQIIDFLRRHRGDGEMGVMALNAVPMWHEMIAFAMAACIACVLKMHPTSMKYVLKQATAAEFNWYSKWGALVRFILCCS